MTSLVSTLLNKNWAQVRTPGRVVRFGDETDKELTIGPICKRVTYCLRTKKIPMSVAQIADAVNERCSRVEQTVRQLHAEGALEQIGCGYNLRYQIV